MNTVHRSLMDTHHVVAHARLADAGVPASEAHAGKPDLFQTLPWFVNLERHGHDSADPVQILRVEGPPGSEMLLPMVRRRRAPAAVYGPVWAALSNYYSSLYGPVGAGGKHLKQACRAAVKHLRVVERAAVIDLQPLDAEGEFLFSIERALRDEGYATHRYFCFGNWYLKLDGRSFSAYYDATVPSRVRNTIRRARKKFDEAGGWDMRIETRDSPQLEQAIAEFDTVYRKSWKVPEPFPEFMPNLIRTAAAQGWLRLGVLRLAGQPIAAQLWLVHEGRALIYKLAYDEAFKRQSAGSVLTHELMRHTIDVDGVAEVDYLTGDDAYKADWMSDRRERVGLLAFNLRRPQGLLSAARHFMPLWWRRLRAAAPSAAEAPVPVADPVPVNAQQGVRINPGGI